MREGINMGIDLGGQRVACFAIAGHSKWCARWRALYAFASPRCCRCGRKNAQCPPACHASEGCAATSGRLTEMLGQASETVGASLARLHDAVHHIDQGITLFDEKLRLVVWNRRFLELIGVPETMVHHGLSLEALVGHYAKIPPHARRTAAASGRAQGGPCAGRPAQRLRACWPQGAVLSIVDRRLPDGSLVSTYTDITENTVPTRPCAPPTPAPNARSNCAPVR